MTNLSGLSIVTVTYNNVVGLTKTYDSICRQVFDKWSRVEWLVIDGGSTDGSAQFSSSVENISLRLFSESDQGIYDAMNKGIALAKMDWVIFLNAGDEFNEFTVLDQLFQHRVGLEMLYGDSIFEHRDIRYKFNAEILGSRSFLSHNCFCHQSIVYNTKCLRLLCGYNLNYQVSSDFDLTFRYAKRFGAVKVNVVISKCELGGVSSVRRLRSLYDRTHSLLVNGGGFERGSIILIFPFQWSKLLLINLFESWGFMAQYRRFKYRNGTF